jgi:hypothetical protein
MLLFIHQITPDDGYDSYIHVHSRLFCWFDQGHVRSHLISILFHKNHNDALKFIKNNFDLSCVGNTEERKTGFHAVPGISTFER